MLNLDVAEKAPGNLEEALWAAIDHARRYDEHAVAGELMLVLLRYTDRWERL